MVVKQLKYCTGSCEMQSSNSRITVKFALYWPLFPQSKCFVNWRSTYGWYKGGLNTASFYSFYLLLWFTCYSYTLHFVQFSRYSEEFHLTLQYNYNRSEIISSFTLSKPWKALYSIYTNTRYSFHNSMDRLNRPL